MSGAFTHPLCDICGHCCKPVPSSPASSLFCFLNSLSLNTSSSGIISEVKVKISRKTFKLKQSLWISMIFIRLTKELSISNMVLLLTDKGHVCHLTDFSLNRVD